MALGHDQSGINVRRYFARKFVIYIVTFYVAVTIDWMIPGSCP